jgi:hypothetical protein
MSSVPASHMHVPPPVVDPDPDGRRGTGWLVFAGTILGLAGFMRIIDAIWAFTYKGALPERLQDGVLGSNLKTYAWVWLIVGILLIVASGLVIMQSQIGRWVGIVAAVVGALSAMVWMPYYPVWSLAYIALGVLVLYALLRYATPLPD